MILGSSFIGCLAFTFSDTFWFNAVEAEVYAMSSLFTSMVVWAMLRWERVENESMANRWLILIAYIIGVIEVNRRIILGTNQDNGVRRISY